MTPVEYDTPVVYHTALARQIHTCTRVSYLTGTVHSCTRTHLHTSNCTDACTHDLKRVLQVNYNVCCPGMDHLVGTYMPEEEWTPKIRVKEAKEIKGALAYDSM